MVGDITSEVTPGSIYTGWLMDSEDVDGQWPLFTRLLMSPIQRAPPYLWVPNCPVKHQYPLSFEKVIAKARDLWVERKRPVNDSAWFEYHLDTDGGLTKEERKRKAEQFAALPLPVYLKCPNCDAIV